MTERLVSLRRAFDRKLEAACPRGVWQHRNERLPDNVRLADLQKALCSLRERADHQLVVEYKEGLVPRRDHVGRSLEEDAKTTALADPRKALREVPGRWGRSTVPAEP